MLKSVITNKKGQGLLELLVALTVLVIALTATLTLIVTSINAARDSKNKLIATHLAREGLEVVRNIRDSNWIDTSVTPEPAWNSGLDTDTEAVLVIDGNSVISLDFNATGMSHSDYTRLQFINDEYLQGDGGVVGNSIFYRLITLEAICRNDTSPFSEFLPGTNTIADDCSSGGGSEVGLRIISEVHWPNPSSNKNIVLEERLYNWQVL